MLCLPFSPDRPFYLAIPLRNPFTDPILTMLSAAFLVALTGTAIGAAVPAAETNHRLVARQDSDNWCGAVKTTNDVKTVEATWTIPTVSVPKGQPSGRDYFAYQWVGTGGTSSCGRNQDLLQCGTSVHVR